MDVKQDTQLSPTVAETGSLNDDIDEDDSAAPPSDKLGARADPYDDRACQHDLQEEVRRYWQQKLQRQHMRRRRVWLTVLRQLHATVAVVQFDSVEANAADNENGPENATLAVNKIDTGTELACLPL